MNRTVIRYINNKPCRGEKLPAMEVENPGVVMVLKDLQHRLKDPSDGLENQLPGKYIH